MIPLTPFNLLIFQIICHASLLWLFFTGTMYNIIILGIVYFFTGCLGMTMTYHRLLSHRSWTCPKLLEYFFALCAGVGLTGSAISWVSIHRQHHRYTDKELDPHSTQFKSWFYCHFLSMFSKVDVKYVPDLIKQKFYILQHKWYFEIGILYGLLMILIFHDISAIIYAWLAPAAILWNAGSMIVSISHRNKKIYNDFSLVILVWGEGYHKNHHDDAKSSKFGKFDIGGIIIQIIEKINRKDDYEKKTRITSIEKTKY